MASENQANLAREKHSDFLQNLGAHSIGVDEIEKGGKKSFVVVAYTQENPDKFPNELEIKSGNSTLKVPLIAKLAEPFKPD
jgi:hypothetical protein